jgi:enoyl-CoA hydratase/carnithine racemase
MHIVLPYLLGPNRARYFMLTGQVIEAREALELGLFAEVLPPDQVLDRAWELAEQLALQSPLVLRYTKVCFAHTIRQQILAGQGYGVLLEGMAAIDDQHRAGYTLDER